MSTPLVMVIDDALDAATFARCRQAIEALDSRLVAEERHGGSIRYRRHQDYASPDPILFGALVTRLFARDLLAEANRAGDLAWRWYAAGLSRGVDLQVTSYGEGSRYTWHTDHLVRGRTHNFILYMTGPTTFDGGELEISYREPPLHTTEVGALRPDLVVTPAPNRLAIMPSHLLHRVTEVRCKSDEPALWETRVTVNGHLRVSGLEGLVP